MAPSGAQCAQWHPARLVASGPVARGGFLFAGLGESIVSDAERHRIHIEGDGSISLVKPYFEEFLESLPD